MSSSVKMMVAAVVGLSLGVALLAVVFGSGGPLPGLISQNQTLYHRFPATAASTALANLNSAIAGNTSLATVIATANPSDASVSTKLYSASTDQIDRETRRLYLLNEATRVASVTVSPSAQPPVSTQAAALGTAAALVPTISVASFTLDLCDGNSTCATAFVPAGSGIVPTAADRPEETLGTAVANVPIALRTAYPIATHGPSYLKEGSSFANPLPNAPVATATVFAPVFLVLLGLVPVGAVVYIVYRFLPSAEGKGRSGRRGRSRNAIG